MKEFKDPKDLRILDSLIAEDEHNEKIKHVKSHFLFCPKCNTEKERQHFNYNIYQVKHNNRESIKDICYTCWNSAGAGRNSNKLVVTSAIKWKQTDEVTRPTIIDLMEQQIERD